MWTKVRLVIAAILTLLPLFTSIQSAQAALLVGPIDPRSVFQGNPNSGFPSYYEDDQGTRVGLIPITGNGVSAPTQIYDAPNPANPYSVFLGFGTEAFYYLATADLSTSAGRGFAEFAIEAAFATGSAQQGLEMVFNRTRVRVQVPAPGTYTFQHPYGTETFTVTQADINTGKGINFTRDVGTTPRGFAAAAGGNMSRFLRQISPAPPPGWIGDGTAVGPVTGSPTGFNAFKLTGPLGVDLDGTGRNFVLVDRFTVSGRLFTPIGPTGLTATVISQTQVNLSWTDNTSTETGYRVERATDGAFTLNLVRFPPLAIDANAFNDTTAAPGTTYFYRVFAISGAADSAPSNVAQVATPVATAVPAAPTGLAATAVSATQINLAWTDNATTETSYRVERADDAAFTLNVVRFPALAANAVALINTPLTPSTIFFYRVFAVNTAGDSLVSNVAQATTPAATVPPAAPGGLTATVFSPTQVNLAWTDNTTAETGYRIERAADSAFTVNVVRFPNLPVNTTTSSDTTAIAGAAYFYRVLAFNVPGDSPPSNVVSISITAPAAPGDLAAYLMGANRVDLLWTDNSDNESGFRIERSADNFATAPTATFSAGANQRTFSDTTVAPPNTYFYRVIALNGAGSSASSNVAAMTPSARLQVGAVDPRSVFQGNPESGFPGYYQDDQGTRISLIPITGDGVSAPTQIYDEVVTTNPYSVFLGFGTEAFYYMATAAFNTSAGRGLAEFAIEAAFAAEDARPGDEMVFNRTRIWIDVPAAGTYTVQHPYGTNTFTVAPADVGVRGIKFTDDIGIVPRDFTGATTGILHRFLRQTTPPPPAGWIGDGASEGPVTGSPTGFNAVRVTGPVGVNLDGRGNNFVQTDQWMVSGRLLSATLPMPGFTRTINPTTGIAPVIVSFTDTSTGTPVKWLWDFGDGTFSTLQNPTKNYTAAGKYTVKLTVTNAAGSGATSQILNVYSAPVASFTNTLPNGLPPVAINFTDTSTGNPASWSWDFGDGTGSSSQNPSKTYLTAGAFTVRLTVTNPAGPSSASKIVSISPNLTAGFTKSVASGLAPLAVSFTDTSTGTITGRSWDFGDGATSSTQNPTKVYTTAGNFTVTLTITDALGTAATSQTVSVFGSLTASFTRTPANGRPPLTMNFTDTSTGNPAARSWNFGDGTGSSLQNPTKTYASFGVYTVTLTVTNPAGQASASQTVTVSSVDPATLKLQVGPIEPRSIFHGNLNSGFPSYYQDDQGTRVSLIPVTGDGVNAPTQTFFPPDPANPYSAFLGFESEAFYYAATAVFNTSAGRGLAEFAVEAAFAAEVARPGDEMVFARTRLWIDVPAAGTYTVQHPYGTHTFNVAAADVGVRGIRLTEDIGVTPRDFFGAAAGPFSRFLRQTVPPPPTGWIGDGGSVGPVTGSPTGFNAVRVTAPAGVNLDGRGNNFVQTDQFSVSARLFVPAPVGPPGAAPSAPTGLTGAAVTTPQGPQVNLAWTDTATTETGYRVERATDGTFTLNVIRMNLGANAAAAADTGVNPGTAYFYRVFAVNGAVDSPASNTAQVAVPPTAPFAASGLAATTVTSTQVILSWTDNATTETGYRLERATDAGFTLSVVQTPLAANATSFIDGTVAAGITYFYRVFATIGTVSSPASNVITVIVPGGGVGPAPIGGGGAAPPPAPDPGTVTLTGLTAPTPLVLNTAGVVQTTNTLSAAGGAVSLRINGGTTAVTNTGAPLTTLSATPASSPPPAPRNNVIVSAFTFGPTGARFSQPVALTISYNPANLPPGVRERSLKIAHFDASANKWVTLGGTVDTAAKTVTVNISGFSTYAIMAEMPAVKITAPADGATVPGGNITVAVEVENFQLEPPGPLAEGKGHLHYYMDVSIPTAPGARAVTAPGTYKASPATSVTWENVPAGKHTFGVQLVNGDHTPMAPPVTATVSVTVAAPPTPASTSPPAAAATTQPAAPPEPTPAPAAPPAPEPILAPPPAPEARPQPAPTIEAPAPAVEPPAAQQPAEVQPAPQPAPSPAQEGQMNWLIILIAVAALAVIGFLFYWIWLRVPRAR